MPSFSFLVILKEQQRVREIWRDRERDREREKGEMGGRKREP